jgi:hypothetical protein
MEKTPGQELSDLFYGLQMTVKILEGIMMEHSDGKRSQSDYESRVHSQSNLLNNNLKGVKPLVEKLFTEAYSRFNAVNIEGGQPKHDEESGFDSKQEQTDSE